MSEFRRRGKRKPKSEINVVPYIDVLLVLLVIFMVTAPIVTPGIINLPSVGAASTPPAKPMSVIVTSDGGLRFQDLERGDGAPRSIDMPGLLAEVQRRQAESPQQPVVISADREVQYEQVVNVMDLLNRQGVSRVGLAVQPQQN